MATGNCYVIVTPDPAVSPHGLEDNNGHFFFLKFGDGPIAGYMTKLDRNSLVRKQTGNQLCLAGQAYRDIEHTNNGQYVGTFLKRWVLVELGFNNRNAATNGETEWFCIRAGPNGAANSIQHLSTDLQNLLTGFPQLPLAPHPIVQNAPNNIAEQSALLLRNLLWKYKP
ncbi:uncharacterized protein PHACADRAFT_209794 [Phanerochaete carnosa HHB-10118-sp]|uniref:Uncharacterized protein n=1 Tax=Phanerochaete carnosa (strain HHB-10118-sp) TaxID=650164 RepID=K5W4U6_PHACS|nr:uncharacterized protein PHACADRAFT_209794 [Phanerochaete carnosa HHB-10118-sp]EKM53964.1 hypothetical protein PHACADRAFT_209794 [Phanerochaete carnosa HHB-10118-sp]